MIELKGKTALSRNETKALLKLCEMARLEGVRQYESIEMKLSRAWQENTNDKR